LLYNEFIGPIVFVSQHNPLFRKEFTMPFGFKNKKGVTYFLHAKVTKTKTGKTQTLYYFAKEKKAGVLEEVPQGYKVAETANGLPVLKKA
jgi:hypothetical protein